LADLRKEKKEINTSKIYSPVGKFAEQANKGYTISYGSWK